MKTVICFSSLIAGLEKASDKSCKPEKEQRMENSIRQPTKKMAEQLKKCHEMQLQGLLCFPEHLKSSLAGLYKRGFVGTKMLHINNKNLLTVFVTKEGEKFLQKMYPE